MRHRGATTPLAARGGEAPGDGSHLIWRPPSQILTVRMTQEVLGRLADELGDPAAEKGGLLLGTVQFDGNYAVTIEATDPIEGAFWRGFPQAHQNPDRRRLELALARWRPHPERPLCAVGYYRTTAAEVLGPSRDDLFMVARHFSAPHNAFLYVRPEDRAAGFACWEYGQVAEAVASQFTLEPGAVASIRAVVEEPEWPAPQMPEPAVAPAAMMPPAPAPPRPVRMSPLVWVAAGLLAVVLLLGGLWIAQRGPAPPATTTSAAALALSVERAGSDYRVTWDRRAPAIATALKGVLTIVDGSFRRQIDLDSPQLRTGSVLYTPASGDVRVELSVVGAGEPITESVQVLSAVAPQALDPAVAAQSAPPLVVRPVNTPLAPKPQVQAPVQESSAQPQQPAAPPRAFTPPPAKESRPGVVLPEPEFATASMSAPAGGPGPLSLPRNLPGPPPAPEPAETKPVPAEEVKPPAPVRVSDYVAPRATSQVWPMMTPIVKNALRQVATGPVQVDVEIAIDAAGRVTGAKSLMKPGPLQQLLSAVSLEASRQWRFEPARLAGQTIPSTMVLSFRFAPPR